MIWSHILLLATWSRLEQTVLNYILFFFIFLMEIEAKILHPSVQKLKYNGTSMYVRRLTGRAIISSKSSMVISVFENFHVAQPRPKETCTYFDTAGAHADREGPRSRLMKICTNYQRQTCISCQQIMTLRLWFNDTGAHLSRKEYSLDGVQDTLFLPQSTVDLVTTTTASKHLREEIVSRVKCNYTFENRERKKSMLNLVAVVTGGQFSRRVRGTRPPPTYTKFNICYSVFIILHLSRQCGLCQPMCRKQCTL